MKSTPRVINDRIESGNRVYYSMHRRVGYGWYDMLISYSKEESRDSAANKLRVFRSNFKATIVVAALQEGDEHYFQY